jgi:hypothetical protein
MAVSVRRCKASVGAKGARVQRERGCKGNAGAKGTRVQSERQAKNCQKLQKSAEDEQKIASYGNFALALALDPRSLCTHARFAPTHSKCYLQPSLKGGPLNSVPLFCIDAEVWLMVFLLIQRHLQYLSTTGRCSDKEKGRK